MMSNPNIDRWYTLGCENGASQELRRLRSAMATEGLAEVRFSFDNDGSVVLVRS